MPSHPNPQLREHPPPTAPIFPPLTKKSALQPSNDPARHPRTNDPQKHGEVAEWSIAPVSKTGVGASLPWVRIPPSPPNRPTPSGYCYALNGIDLPQRSPARVGLAGAPNPGRSAAPLGAAATPRNASRAGNRQAAAFTRRSAGGVRRVGTAVAKVIAVIGASEGTGTSACRAMARATSAPEITGRAVGP